MKTYELIILTLAYSDKGMIAGRTLLQKTLYFLNEKLKLGLDFTPHYYGPYSSEVTEVISSLKSNGIVKEELETFLPFDFKVTSESRLYIYQLPKIGKEIASLIENRQKEQANRIKDTLEEMRKLGTANDYKTLSIAAKMHHILKIEGKTMTTDEILKEADALNWEISREEAEVAINFLKGIELIEVKKKI
ncbi:MAG: hypothetical protein HY769_07100 [Candidatus Stahlbacteria bacterium]|nr:hypothetical protein [Candidatus Stahlbacteria bacterium]